MEISRFENWPFLKSRFQRWYMCVYVRLGEGVAGSFSNVLFNQRILDKGKKCHWGEEISLRGRNVTEGKKCHSRNVNEGKKCHCGKEMSLKECHWGKEMSLRERNVTEGKKCHWGNVTEGKKNHWGQEMSLRARNVTEDKKCHWGQEMSLRTRNVSEGKKCHWGNVTEGKKCHWAQASQDSWAMRSGLLIIPVATTSLPRSRKPLTHSSSTKT